MRDTLQVALIERALTASEAAYKPSWVATTFEDKCGAFASITETDAGIELAWRGTDEANDWGKNLRAYPWRYGGAWVHRGFMAGHASLWPRIITEIQTLIRWKKREDPDAPPPALLVTGHSYGAALAELTCLFLHAYPGSVSLVTFGKPNVFLKPRAARFAYLAYQTSVVSGSDGVARVPATGYGPDLGQAMLYLATTGLKLDYWIPQMDDGHRCIIREDFNLADMGKHHPLTEYRARWNRMLQRVA